MIEVSNINPINKGNVLASCSVYIKPWHVLFHEVLIFEKGANRWISLPSRKYEANGETKYVELVSFDSDAVKRRFRDQIMTAVDKFLAGNPDCTPEDVIKEDAELPF